MSRDGGGMVMKLNYQIRGLDCAHCANKIQTAVAKIPLVETVTVDFLHEKLTIVTSGGEEPIETQVRQVIKKIEPTVEINSLAKKTQATTGKLINQWKVSQVVFVVFGLLFLRLVPLNQVGMSALYWGLYVLIGGEILKKAALNIRQGQIFDENFLMSIATLGAMAIGEYQEGIAVMLLYQIGEFFQDLAVNHSRNSVQALLAVRPEFARLQTSTGEKLVAPAEVKVGDVVALLPGEKVPLDGHVLEGSGEVDTAALTGESLPRFVKVGDQLLSGSILQGTPLLLKVEKRYTESTISRILELVENASTQKAKTEHFISKFAKIYTPIVVSLAVLLVLVPTLIWPTNFHEWLSRGLTFLVISCPCALVISVPLSFFAGIGGASRQGILVKGSNYLEQLAQVETIVFDKTGTLTLGRFELEKISSDNPEKCLMLAASLERFSNHPIAQSVVSAYTGNYLAVENVHEKVGYGITGTIAGKQTAVGNQRLFPELTLPQMEETASVIYVVQEGQYLGHLVIADQLKPEARTTVSSLRKQGQKMILLTGDHHLAAQKIAQKLVLKDYFSELLPIDKVRKLEEIRAASNGKVAFVGDGINDAPVLTMADVGIAMGGLGSDAAIEAADVVIMNDDVSQVVSAIRLAKRTMQIVKQNIVFSIGVKVIVLALGALGIASMGLAIFADVGVTLLAVANAMRNLRGK
ncbi:MAG: heavy metal translocating P-type ATPase [Enterococcus sp.]